jgi:hypothetical protein
VTVISRKSREIGAIYRLVRRVDPSSYKSRPPLSLFPTRPGAQWTLDQGLPRPQSPPPIRRTRQGRSEGMPSHGSIASQPSMSLWYIGDRTGRFNAPALQHLIATTLLVIAFSAFAGDLPIQPDPRLMPGAVLATDTITLCQPGYSKGARHTSGKLKAAIYRTYMPNKSESQFEVDHLIPLERGGSDIAANVRSQSYDTMPWSAHRRRRRPVHHARRSSAPPGQPAR